MITDFHKDCIICPKCGHIRYKIEKSYIIKPVQNSKNNECYDLTAENIKFICLKCGHETKTFLDTNLKPIGLNLVPTNT